MDDVDYEDLEALWSALEPSLADVRSLATPVLSLLASRGAEEAWNDRRTSREHLGIPLLSERFVAEIPMISQLLNEIGFAPASRGSEAGFVTKTLADVNGIRTWSTGAIFSD